MGSEMCIRDSSYTMRSGQKRRSADKDGNKKTEKKRRESTDSTATEEEIVDSQTLEEDEQLLNGLDEDWDMSFSQ